jgi:cyclopropane fatty-acyl-phospholipid synthase-like methyltransferase
VDIGCGGGKFLRYMINSRIVTKLVGIDIDEEALKNSVYDCKPNLYDTTSLRMISVIYFTY